ncbi:MAG: UvrD-helicase domain-containing protein, partial [Planctomycetota bacterium]
LDLDDPAGISGQIGEIQTGRLAEELDKQIEFCRYAVETIRNCWPITAIHAEAVTEHQVRLEDWRETLTAAAWGPVADEIREFSFGRAKSKPRNIDEQTSAFYDAAKGWYDRVKELFKGRLQGSICLFTHDQYADGLQQVAPYVKTLARLVTEFDAGYRSAKSAQAAVDFNDLQRCAFGLLSDRGDPDSPSEVARQLQQQYRYILVDEFQDIDPLQEAILRLISTESADPPVGNLFTVGDIKQSIYRFRLAEPALFTGRADAFADKDAAGELIHLQDNFRSRESLVEAVNSIFQPLMRKGFGGSDYDDSARLYAGAVYPQSELPFFDKPAVELHLLEPVTAQTSRMQDSQDEGDGNQDDEMELEGIEREAYLIGCRIQEWMGVNGERKHVAGKAEKPGLPPTYRPFEYRDAVILLRALPHKAEPMAEILRRMGIPVLVERDNSGMDTTEFRDVISLLRLLDNQQQDIPLAAVLRSPLLSERFSETDMLKIRLLNRDVPFHQAVGEYARDGRDRSLSERLDVFLSALQRYRSEIRHTPVSEVIWDIYQHSNYLSYVSGLPDGMRRLEHLLRLHELSRQFGRFARQGLRRFLSFIDQVLESGRGVNQPAGAGADENVVRIMTIHASKGLEFPVVVLADMQKKFNFSDLNSTVLLDGEFGLAIRAADPDRRVYYPTFVHQLASQRCRLEDLSEELRVLYVALTRAREHLMLVGRYSPVKVVGYRTMHQRLVPRQSGLPQLQLESAGNPLDWLLAALGRAPAEAVRWDEANDNGSALFKVVVYPRSVTDGWRIPPAVETARARELGQLADLKPLAAGEPRTVTDESEEIIQALAAEYPALELTTLPARVSVSELKRRWDTTRDPDERLPVGRRMVRPPGPLFAVGTSADGAVGIGTVTHRFLQHLDLHRPCDAADLEDQCAELVEAGCLTPADADAVMLDAAAWFFGTELGGRIRDGANRVQREVSFVARIPPEQYDSMVTAHDSRDVVMLRGIVDLLLTHDSYIEIVDYKTDRIDAKSCPARAESYGRQVAHYASAMQDIYRRPVNKKWLVFLHPRRIIQLDIDGS